MHSRILASFAIGLLAALSGCESKPKYASVSGRILLDGKPLANAAVMFQPIPPEGSAFAAAPGSSGRTNANGEYTLKVSTGENGAWVGKHRVMIELFTDQAVVNSDERPRGGWPQMNLLPERYNINTELTFEVPASGTAEANFLDLTTK